MLLFHTKVVLPSHKLQSYSLHLVSHNSSHTPTIIHLFTHLLSQSCIPDRHGFTCGGIRSLIKHFSALRGVHVYILLTKSPWSTKLIYSIFNFAFHLRARCASILDAWRLFILNVFFWKGTYQSSKRWRLIKALAEYFLPIKNQGSLQLTHKVAYIYIILYF